MKKDKGLELSKVLRIQRQAFVRLTNGERLITNPFLYNQMEKESYRLQCLIGAENKKKIKKSGISKSYGH